MLVLISIISILTLILIVIKYEWGVGLFLVPYFLVPIESLYLGVGIAIGKNLLYLIMLILLFVWSENKGGVNRKCIKLITPFLYLFLIEAILIPVHFSRMPIASQLDIFRVDIMGLFLPLVILTIVYIRNDLSVFYVRVLYAVIAMTSLYTLFLVTMPGSNPYVDILGNLFVSYDDTGQDRVLDEGVRIFGYISSVYSHVTEYGDFLIFSSAFLLYQIKKDRTIVPKILFGLVMLCVLVCGSRSVLMAEAGVILLFILQRKQIKVFFVALFSFFVVFVLIQQFLPDYVNFIKSIRDGSISGSTFTMRVSQLQGCFESISQNPLFGNGYGWTGWYRTVIGRHPTMLSFESIIIQVLCNNGIVGVSLYIWLVFYTRKVISKVFPGNEELRKNVMLLLFGYFLYTFFTGDYGALRMMLVFYALIISKEFSNKTVNETVQYSNKQLTARYEYNK